MQDLKEHNRLIYEQICAYHNDILSEQIIIQNIQSQIDNIDTFNLDSYSGYNRFDLIKRKSWHSHVIRCMESRIESLRLEIITHG